MNKITIENLQNNENIEKTIRIGTLIRNRDWILPEYLNHLYNLNYDKKLLTIYWLVNNSTDSSLELLQEFKDKYSSEYNKIIIEENNKSKLPNDVRNQDVRIKQGIYSHLADMRNYMFSKAKEDYLFNIDSDILVEPECLNKLLSVKVEMVSAWIYNGYEYQDGKEYYKYTNMCVPHTYIIQGGLQRQGTINLKKRDIRETLRNGYNIVEVLVTGAICLYSKDLYSNKKVKFEYHIDGEDTSYCINAIKNGYNIYGCLVSYNQHIMNKYWLEKYRNNEKID